MEQNKNQLTQDELENFTGDLERWRHSLNRQVIYTPGVRYLAEKAGAYWLIDAIASYLVPDVLDAAAQHDARVLGLHFWNLEVADDHSAFLYASVDNDVKPFVTQEIPYTDFPLKRVAVWAGFDGEHWVLYLPSEH